LVAAAPTKYKINEWTEKEELMRSYLSTALLAFTLVCLTSGLALADPGQNDNGGKGQNNAPAPLLAAGAPGAAAVAAAAAAACLRRFRKSQKD
jgi:hypothetical protein